jgi:TfoX/Sxy family transcriptional regulator of competence genes
MAWKKAPQWLVEKFSAVVPPGIERRAMFGYPAAFVQGNMAFGLFEEHLVMRVAEPDLLDLRNQGATAFEPMAGRPMKGWVTVPDAVVKDEVELKRWVLRALTFAAGLPAKGGSARPAVALKKVTAKKKATATATATATKKSPKKPTRKKK